MAELEAHFGKPRVSCELIQGSGGIFDVVVDGERLYSKHDTGRFPQYREVIGLIEKKILAG